MKFRKIIRKSFLRNGRTNVAGGVNGVVAATVNESSAKTSVHSSQRIVQRSGTTDIREEHTERRDG
jgi:hypothetical protein